MRFNLWSFTLLAITFGFSGCSPSLDKRTRIHGTVTLDGSSLTAGKIRLFALTGGVGTDGAIVNGAYDIPADRGVTAGSYRVEISVERSTGRKVPDRDGEAGAMKDETVESIPARYNKDSTLKIDFDPSIDKAHDFDLKSKP